MVPCSNGPGSQNLEETNICVFNSLGSNCSKFFFFFLWIASSDTFPSGENEQAKNQQNSLTCYVCSSSMPVIVYQAFKFYVHTG